MHTSVLRDTFVRSENEKTHDNHIISDDDWAAATEDNFLGETETGTNLTLPRLTRSPERLSNQIPARGISPSTRNRRAAELRQRSPSPQYQPRNNPSDIATPRERFQDAKEKFRAMEKREAIIKQCIPRQVENNRVVHRLIWHVNRNQNESSSMFFSISGYNRTSWNNRDRRTRRDRTANTIRITPIQRDRTRTL